MLHYRGGTYQTTSWMRCPELDLYKVASPSFLGQTDLCFDTDCHTIYTFLRSFPEPALKSIKKLHLTAMTAVEYWSDLDHYARKLGRFIVRDMDLESITLPLPGDKNADSNKDTDVRKDGNKIERYPFTWTLHEAVIDAFRRGRFTEVKFAHSELYPDALNVFSFRDVQIHMEKMLWGNNQLLSDRRDRYWDSFYESQAQGVACQDTLEVVFDFVQKVWNSAGYNIEYGEGNSYMGEVGTVLVLRRVGESLKRPAADELDQDARRQRSDQ